ncbi:leucine-rich repeat-containing protein 75B isoform X2 [Natator depressus]|uniref:leucine-rich repeat-containing protein 75B isoform X2 n=1 Tax=Natator depressus TaxID=27790 RepID=UPI003EBE150D
MGSRLSRQSSLEEESASGEDSCPRLARKEPHRRAETNRGDFQFASLILNSEKLSGVLRKNNPAPYVRRVGWIREIQATIREHKREHAVHILRLLRKEYDPWKSADRICRQLIYHLSPHSTWRRHGMPRRKSQACLKTSLQKKLSQDSMDLSGIPLTMRDVHRMAYYLQNNGDNLTAVDLSFTEMTDDMVRLLLPFFWALPKLTHLSLNGNRLTRATMKELTDTMKDLNKFPCLAWIDLGNNVDVSSMPQPLLVGLRKRVSQQTTLPTIYESLDCEAELSSGHEASCQEEEGGVAEDKDTPCDFPQQCCER